jgi:hypothetical protein
MIEPLKTLSNQRHEIFAQELAQGKSATEAYTLAGYKGDRTAASRLSTNVNVMARVQELQERGAKKAEVTVESLIGEAEQVRELAMNKTQLSAANTAIRNKAQLSGVWIDKTEVTNSIDLHRMGKADIEKLLVDRYGREGADELLAWCDKWAQRAEAEAQRDRELDIERWKQGQQQIETKPQRRIGKRTG